jgi:hypothetical protein
VLSAKDTALMDDPPGSRQRRATRSRIVDEFANRALAAFESRLA